ncbi:MAG: tetratricopeptide repeat protein, partial [Chloroflexi bacterium]|nr:tetratricopeptide repeat protein [Chloroflexota bacterium]
MDAGPVQSADARELVVTGPPVQMAAYVAGAADAGKVWVTQPVRASTERVFLYHTPSDAEPMTSMGVAELAGVKDRPRPARGLPSRRARLVGREDALAAMLDTAQSLQRGIGGLIWIEGEAGIGKSRLMQEFAAAIESQAQVWFGQCSPQRSGQAFSLVANVLVRMLDLRPTETVEQMMKRIDAVTTTWPVGAQTSRPYIELLVGASSKLLDDEKLANLGPDQLRQQMFVALRNLFKNLAAIQPAVLLLDDLHWIDPISADLLFFLSNMVPTIPILFVCAQRWEENEKPVERLVKTQQLHPDHTRRIFLDRLSLAESQALLSDLLPEASLTSGLQALILERSEGNPFYIEEIIRMLIELGYLRLEDEAWVYDEKVAVGDLPLPPSLGALIRSRIDALPGELKHVLQCAAVIGSPVEMSLAGTVAAVPRVEDMLLRLEARGMLRRAGDGSQWHFSHTLMETAVYDGMLRARRQELHQKVAHALESHWSGNEESHANELAYHFSQANQPASALKYLVLAGEHAFARNANEEALTYFTEAAQLMGGQSHAGEAGVTDDLRWRVINGLGDAYRFVGEYTASTTTLGKGLALMKHIAVSDDRRAGLYRRLGETSQKQGLLEQAVEYFTAALDTLGEPATHDALAEAARVTGSLAFTYLLQGRFDRAEETCKASLAYAQKCGNLGELATAESVLGGVCYRQGKWKEAFHHTTQAMALREQMGYMWGVASNKSNLGILAASAGEWKQAESFFTQSLKLRQELGDVEGVAIVHNNLALLLREQGNLDTAEEHFRNSLVVAEPLNMAFHVTTSKLGLGQVQLLRGNADAALALIDTCVTEANTIGAADLLGEVRLVRSEILLAQSRASEARTEAQLAITLANGNGNRRAEAAGWRLVSQIELNAGNTATAEQAIANARLVMAEVTDELEKGRVMAQNGHVLLHESRYAEARKELQAARDLFARLGATLDLASVELVIAQHAADNSCHQHHT